jgi:thioredoxin-dependent peroxiredoxin
MATITLKGNPIHTAGDLPKAGNEAPDFSLLRGDLSRAKLSSFPGKKVLNIFPSIDTPVCATSVRKFNKLASEKGLTVLNISEDLVFAQKRFCGAEGIDKCESLSAFRSSFGKDYGVEITEGPFAGLTARAVLVLDENNKVLHAELVPEIAQEPNYDAAIAAAS